MIKFVVLDDDPTGIQTVHDCLLVTRWDEATIREAFAYPANIFYILTNTRAMTADEAARVTREAMEMVISVGVSFGFSFSENVNADKKANANAKAKAKALVFISRSDSCLRGHFPLETNIMRQVLQENGIEVWHKIPFAPCFIEAGRFTIDGVHYMKDGDQLVPISQTEFAHDNVFAYTNSTLTEYIKEKGGNPEEYQIVNAASYDELDAYTASLLNETKDFNGAVVIRSSSSLPKSISGLSVGVGLSENINADKKAKANEQLKANAKANAKAKPSTLNSQPGLFVVGSHVAKTTRQLNALLACPGVKGIEIDVEKILNEQLTINNEQLTTAKANALKALQSGLTPVIYTSRKEIRVDDPDLRQRLGQQVSDYLVTLVREIINSVGVNLSHGQSQSQGLSYLVAKGGITSHDILTKALEVRSATVLGQVIPSVPCIQTEHFPYIIFPGNVGNDESLKELYLKLNGE